MQRMTKDKITINIEPNHPLTRDMIGFSLITDGEKILKAAPELGYSHCCIEKSAQDRPICQYLPMVEKIDYSASFFYLQAFFSAIESLSGIELPVYAQYARVLAMELNRITAHLLFIGRFSGALHANNAVFQAFYLRDEVLNILKKVCGGQKPCYYYVLGGIKKKNSDEILEQIKTFIPKFTDKFTVYADSIKKNPVFSDSARNIGIIDTQNALEYSITGVNLRASGLNLDFRKEKPYLVYDKLEFQVPTAFEGDCYSRLCLRIDEIKIALNLVKQCVDRLLATCGGDCNLGINLMDFCPKNGTAVSFTESPRGLVMCHIVSEGGSRLKRVKWRTPSFYSVQILEKLLTGHNLTDFTVIFNSLDIISSEVDR